LKNLGANVRRLRVERAMTQEGLAEASELNTRTLQKLEAGQFAPLVTTVARLRDALACSADELMPREPRL
jgi:transcriptional regulator with XRE-family HTH domain